MLSKQILFYESLSEDEKYIVHLCAIQAKDVNIYTIRSIVQNRKVTDKFIKEVFKICKGSGILYNMPYSQDCITPEFLVWLFPLLVEMKSEWKNINSKGDYISFYSSAFPAYLRDYLYALFLDRGQLENKEIRLRYNADQTTSALTSIFIQPLYEPVIKFINKSMLANSGKILLREAIADLNSLSRFNEDRFKQYFDISFSQAIFRGDFENALKLEAVQIDPILFFFTDASRRLLIENNMEEAYSLFEKGMKKQRGELKSTYIPFKAEYALYYLVTLLSRPVEEQSTVIQKIIDSLGKKDHMGGLGFHFLLMCQYCKNNQIFVKEHLPSLQEGVFTNQNSFADVWFIITLYFIGEKLKDPFQESALDLAEKAYRNNYLIYALEVTYVLMQWWPNDAKIADFYKKIQQSTGFASALSLLVKQEDWEKNLNALLGLTAGKKSAQQASNNKEKYRVVYYISPKNMYLQPVLQTRQNNGNWSTGRNIAMKSFYEGKAKGMSEQDFHISKCMHYSSSYYSGDFYEFKETVFKELIGHPYIFLDGSDNVPVEMVEGKPIVSVTKNNKGYRLTSDLKTFDKKFFIQKETNTRYLVYNLTESQLQILQTIKQKDITIPEKGKNLLMKVLTNFSTQLTVHSDLLGTSDSQNVKVVAPDSKIRVQLLPFGDGLKAELFAKPFGDFPPYCKPGLGGKVLISSQQDTQLQVVRDLKKEKEYAASLYNEIQTLESIDASDDLISFDEPLDSLYLLDILEKYKDISVVEWPEGEKYKIKKHVDFGNLNLKITSSTNWFELQGELQVDEKTVLSIQQLLELTKKGHGNFVELSSGEFLVLSEKLRKQLNELGSFAQKGKKGVQINKFSAVSMGGFFDELEHLKTDKVWKDFQKQLQHAGKTETLIPENLQAELRPYQEEGFRWMARLSAWGAGACLADDMGLGKTVQSLAVLLHRSHSGPSMVICPVSVIPNWISEINKFAPTLNVKTLQQGNREEIIQSLGAGDLLVTSYGLLQSEEKLLSGVMWANVVLDEAHTIKNYTTKTSKAAMSLQASFKLALTGTPIQNYLSEMWNLFNFINPGLLGSLQHFTDTFIKPEGDLARKHLKKLITPFILRRTKTAVLDELPPKTEIIKKIRLSDEESAFYEALRRQAVLSLEADSASNGTKQLKALAEITRLRQACCNTALVNNGEVKIPSTKLAAFIEIVEELKENKHRAIVFSQFVTHLALIKKALDKRKISYQYLDGSTPLAEREKSVKRFQSGEGDLFLISLKAGGLGLNLTAADFVIHLDPWWNPAIEDQASDRAHRIGQTRPVTVYRLIAENTIEEKIIRLHNTKRDLADSLLEGSDHSAKLSINELMELIKEG